MVLHIPLYLHYLSVIPLCCIIFDIITTTTTTTATTTTNTTTFTTTTTNDNNNNNNNNCEVDKVMMMSVCSLCFLAFTHYTRKQVHPLLTEFTLFTFHLTMKRSYLCRFNVITT
uniref:SJCHGC02845 protein n=1 Tax=Schistosoma japonicum TaxID=6182 RepID=Q5DBT5_SCHJA|nr:SJCHGC02845 protein [Schistosoma japonicum]